MIQPFVNPNYYQYQNPFMDRQSQFQQYPMQSIGSSSITGKIVNQAEEITANDVPMNGTYAIFPKSDMSAIYAKAWDATGKIKTQVFVPQLQENEDKTQETDVLVPHSEKISLKKDINNLLLAFQDSFDSLNTRLDTLERSITDRQPRSRNKREVGTDE